VRGGRRDNPPHKKIESEEIGVPEIPMDYCFIRREEEEQVLTILGMKDRATRAIQAIRVEKKGWRMRVQYFVRLSAFVASDIVAESSLKVTASLRVLHLRTSF
jgi:hypothetical protein